MSFLLFKETTEEFLDCFPKFLLADSICIVRTGTHHSAPASFFCISSAGEICLPATFSGSEVCKQILYTFYVHCLPWTFYKSIRHIRDMKQGLSHFKATQAHSTSSLLTRPDKSSQVFHCTPLHLCEPQGLNELK